MGGPGHDAVGASQEKRQQIGRAVMPVHGIDATVAEQTAKGGPDTSIERMALVDLDIIHAHVGGEPVERIHLVAPITDVAHGDAKTPRIGAGGADQDGFLRSAAGAADASKLENAADDQALRRDGTSLPSRGVAQPGRLRSFGSLRGIEALCLPRIRR